MWHPYTSTIALEAERELRRTALLREARLAHAHHKPARRSRRRRKPLPVPKWRWTLGR